MTKSIPKVFIDANVWFSAFYGSLNCEKIIKAFVDDKILAVISQQVLEESVRNFKEKIPHLLPYFQELIYRYPPLIITDPKNINPSIKEFVDRFDQPIFSSAIIAKVDFFITGNLKHFNIKKLQKKTKIKIVTPKQLVDVLHL